MIVLRCITDICEHEIISVQRFSLSSGYYRYLVSVGIFLNEIVIIWRKLFIDEINIVIKVILAPANYLIYFSFSPMKCAFLDGIQCIYHISEDLIRSINYAEKL